MLNSIINVKHSQHKVENESLNSTNRKKSKLSTKIDTLKALLNFRKIYDWLKLTQFEKI